MEKSHSLASWMEGRISQAAFAELVKCSASHLSLVLSGGRKPSYDFAKRLSDATDGSVSVETIFNDAARLKSESAA